MLASGWLLPPTPPHTHTPQLCSMPFCYKWSSLVVCQWTTGCPKQGVQSVWQITVMCLVVHVVYAIFSVVQVAGRGGYNRYKTLRSEIKPSSGLEANYQDSGTNLPHCLMALSLTGPPQTSASQQGNLAWKKKKWSLVICTPRCCVTINSTTHTHTQI